MLIGLYLIVGFAIYIMQDRLILSPDKIPENLDYGLGDEVEINVDEDISINNIWIKNGTSSKGVFLYFHGNKGNIIRALYQLRAIQNPDYDYFITDYRGYGKSDGTTKSDETLLNDADAVYQFLKSKYAEDKIYVLGYSLGTGMASYVASLNNPKYLFLVAPFTSLTSIKNKYLWFYPDFLLKFKLPVKKYLESVKCNVSIIHGTQDNIIDYQNSENLKELFPSKVNLISSQGQSHRGIIFDPLVTQEVRRVLNKY